MKYIWLRKMEARRLIRFGSSSHVVSIPKSWVNENGLKKGDLIFIERNGNGELILLPHDKRKERGKKEISIDISSKENECIEREIVAAYVQGCDNIMLTGKDIRNKMEDIRGIFKKLSKNLMGLEILEKSADKIVISNLFDAQAISVGSIISRADVNLRNMFEELLAGLEQGFTQKRFNEIYATDDDINKFYFLMWKLASNSLHEETKESVRRELINSWWFIMNMEKIGDELKRIARILVKTKLSGPSKKALFQVLSDVKDTYLKIIGAHHKKDTQLTVSLMSKKGEMIKECIKLAEKDIRMGVIAEQLKSTVSFIHEIAKCATYFLKNDIN
jgi:phosphate uptake regulator